MDSWYLRQEEPQVRAKVREGLLKASEEDLKNRRQAMERFAGEGTVSVLGNRARIEEAGRPIRQCNGTDGVNIKEKR